jgi:hypothetical protein
MGLRISQSIKTNAQDSKFKFKKIIVSKIYEVENGILGLDRDNYLSIVEFLHSSILRKV